MSRPFSVPAQLCKPSRRTTRRQWRRRLSATTTATTTTVAPGKTTRPCRRLGYPSEVKNRVWTFGWIIKCYFLNHPDSARLSETPRVYTFYSNYFLKTVEKFRSDSKRKLKVNRKFHLLIDLRYFCILRCMREFSSWFT